MSHPKINEPSGNNPNMPTAFLFIIGAMKSGTTSLFEILGQHPAISQSAKKEPDFYCEDRGDDATKAYMSLWNWQGGSHSYALEASVAYTKAPYVQGVPERIYHSVAGKSKFIYMLRDPLKRIESQVRHGLFAGWGKSLDEGIPDDAICFSRYAMQIDQYLEYFPRDDCLLVTLEEFTLDPSAVLKRVCHFLGVDSDFEFSAIGDTRNSGDFFNAPSVVAKLTQSQVGQIVAQTILSERTKGQLRKLIARMSSRGAAEATIGRFKLTSKEEDLVIAQLAPDLRRLRDEFGIDVEKYWKHSH